MQVRPVVMGRASAGEQAEWGLLVVGGRGVVDSFHCALLRRVLPHLPEREKQKQLYCCCCEIMQYLLDTEFPS